MLGAMGRPRWSAAELAAATPEVLAAARWELFASRIWPAGLEAELARPDDPKAEKQWVKNERSLARVRVRQLRVDLFPRDEKAPD